MKTDVNIDPFTIEIVKNSLTALGDEMFYALARTSMSPIVYEVLDYATGLTNAEGKLLTLGNGATSFIGTLSAMVRQVIDKFQNNFQPGDIIIINDTYGGGGSHLSDVGLVMPIFYKGELVAFSANKAHWTDVGGKDPGSFTSSAKEIFQEGLQLPGVKLFEEGIVNETLVDIIKSNIRFPDLSLGDMWAQVASLRTGGRRFEELCSKYGRKVVMESIDDLLEHSKKMVRKELAQLPKGEYYADGYVDEDGFGNGPFKIKVRIEITNDQFICDFRGSHLPVTGPINCSRSSLTAGIRTIFLAITNMGDEVNDGVFEPLKVITDDHSIFNAKKPAAVSLNAETRLAGADLVWKALAPVIPHRLSSGHLLSVCSMSISGNHHDTKKPFLLVEPSVGGWGASEKQDGAKGQFCIGDGETYNIPVEIAETRYGILVEEYSFRCDGVGSGQYVGGSGVVRTYRVMTDGQTLQTMFGRHKSQPWGVNGGEQGSPNEVYIYKANGEIDGPFGMLANYHLNKGDIVKLITATGGGYGNPYNRNIDTVIKDVKNGFISFLQAKETFGVIIEPKTFEFQGTTIERQNYSTSYS